MRLVTDISTNSVQLVWLIYRLSNSLNLLVLSRTQSQYAGRPSADAVSSKSRRDRIEKNQSNQ